MTKTSGGIELKGMEVLNILLWIIVFALTISTIYAMKLGIEVVAEQEITYSFTNFARALDDACSFGTDYISGTDKYLGEKNTPEKYYIKEENKPILPEGYFICWNCEDFLNKYNSEMGTGHVMPKECEDNLCLVKYGKVLKSFDFFRCWSEINTRFQRYEKGDLKKADFKGEGIFISYEGKELRNFEIRFGESGDEFTLRVEYYEQ